ncbi:HD-GYP domain-containing protein [Candidatus Hydrogenedentota bacterium]
MADRVASEEYISISVDCLLMDTVCDFDLYVELANNNEPVLYRTRSLAFDQPALDRLRESGITQLFVRGSDKRVYNKYVEEHLAEAIADTSVATDVKAVMVYNSAQNLMRDVFENPLSGTNLARGSKMARNTMDLILTDESAFKKLMEVTEYDYYTYTHSVNVGVMSIALGERIGLSHDELAALGEGALLHDIGKNEVALKIVIKNGPLTATEWVEVKGHPARGGEILRESENIIHDAYYAAEQHHERCCGGGYPFGLTGDKMHIFGKVCAVADVFDALTTERSYKQALDPFASLQIMKNEMRDNFDEQIFRTFLLLMRK